MAWPGFLPDELYTAGLPCPTPELRELFWVEDLAEPQPKERYVFTGLNPTIRTDQELTGTAEVSVVVSEVGFPGLQAELILENVWDVVILDSFDDDICPPPAWDRDEPYSPRTPFHLGNADGRIALLTKGHQDASGYIQGLIRPNPVAPGGLGASCLFRNLYIPVETWTGGWMQVTPIVNGEKLDDEAIQFAVPFISTEERALHRFEIPLTREYDAGSGVVTRAGLVGTWFTCEILVIDAFGCGRLAVGDIELEYEVLDDHNLGLAFTGEFQPDPGRVPWTTWFLGTADGDLLKGGETNQDNGSDIPVYLKTNDLAPAGAGGEAVFYQVLIAVTRNNITDLQVMATPIVDGIELEQQTLTFLGVPESGGVGRMATEHQVLFLSQFYRPNEVDAVSKYNPRGAWFQLILESTEAPDGTFIVEGIELEMEIVRESLEDVTNA